MFPVTQWSDILPSGWSVEQLAPFEHDLWFRAEFPDAQTRCDRLRRAIAGLPPCSDPAFDRGRAAVEEALTFIGSGESDVVVSRLLSDAHHSVIMAHRRAPSETMTAIALVLSALRAWLLEPHVAPLRAVSRDLGWARIPGPFATVATETALLLGSRNRGDSGAVFMLPVDDLRVRPALELVADQQFVCNEYASRTRRWVHPAEAAALRLARRQGGTRLASSTLRAALRRYATDRYDAAADRVEHCRELLRACEASEEVDAVMRAANLLGEQCENPTEIFDLDALFETPPSQEECLVEATVLIKRASRALFETADAGDTEAVERMMARYDPDRGAAVIAWGHSLLAEIEEADDERWIRHKRNQLDTEDRGGIAIVSAAATLAGGLRRGNTPSEVVIACPPRLDRARECLAEAEVAIEEMNMARARFWIERAERYRRCRASP